MKRILKLKGTRIVGWKDKHGCRIHLLDKFLLPTSWSKLGAFTLIFHNKYGLLLVNKNVIFGAMKKTIRSLEIYHGESKNNEA